MKMNKFYLLVAVMVITAGVAKAQYVDLVFGVKAGVNYGTLPTSLQTITVKKER